MKLYKDRFSEGELFSDTYPMKLVHDGQVIRVKCKHISRKEGVDDALIGGNASQEEACEGTDEATIAGLDVVVNNRLMETGYGSKKDFLLEWKKKMKAITAAMEENNEDVEAFKAVMPEFTKMLTSKFKDIVFYIDEKLDEQSVPCFLIYEKDEEDGDETPYMYFVKAAMVEEKQ